MKKLMQKMRQIGAGIILSYHDDLDYDERLLDQNEGLDFVWMPGRGGTHISFLAPHWREYGLLLHRHYTRVPGEYAEVTPYYGNASTGELNPITWEEMKRFFEELPEPEFELRQRPDSFGVRYHNFAQAQRALEEAPIGAQLIETNINRVLATAPLNA